MEAVAELAIFNATLVLNFLALDVTLNKYSVKKSCGSYKALLLTMNRIGATQQTGLYTSRE